MYIQELIPTQQIIQNAYTPMQISQQSKYHLLCTQMQQNNQQQLYKITLSNNIKQNLGLLEFKQMYYLTPQHILIVQNNHLILYAISKHNQINNLNIQQDVELKINSTYFAKFEVMSICQDMFILHYLDLMQVQQDGTRQNLYTLTQYNIQLKNEQAILMHKSVSFSASVRSLQIKPLGNEWCLMTNPNSTTNKRYQYIIWDDSKKDSIKVKETNNELKGTVAEVLYYKNQVIFVYNSNGIGQQYICSINLENFQEQHTQIVCQKQYQFIKAQQYESLVLFSCQNMFDEFIMLYDLESYTIQKQIVCPAFTLIYSLNCYISIDQNGVLILIQKINPELMATHYMHYLLKDLYDNGVIQSAYELSM